MVPLFIFDTHMNSRIYNTLLVKTFRKRAVLKKAKLKFVGDFTFGYPTIEKTGNEKDKVYGLLVQFYTKEKYDDFVKIIKNTRTNWRCEMKKVLVVDDEKRKVKAHILLLSPYVKERGTRYGRREVPLKECFETMLECYNENNFNKKYLYKALNETISEYYNVECEVVANG